MLIRYTVGNETATGLLALVGLSGVAEYEEGLSDLKRGLQ